MRKNIPFFVAGCFLFFFFVAFSYLVDKDKLRSFDFDTTVRLQNNIPRSVDNFFSFFSSVGSFEILTITLCVLLVFRRKIIFGLSALAAYIGFHLVELYGKTFVDQLPPPEFMLRTKRLAEFPQFHVRAEYSYPSGHSGRTVFLSILLIIFFWRSKRFSKKTKMLWISGIVLFDILMFLSRVYLGEHWTSDVLGGVLLGSAVSFIAISTFHSSSRSSIL